MANLQWQTIQSRYEPVQRFTPVQLQGFEDVINSVQSASSQVLERANQQSQQQQQNQNPQGNPQASVNNPTISQGAQSAPVTVPATNISSNVPTNVPSNTSNVKISAPVQYAPKGVPSDEFIRKAIQYGKQYNIDPAVYLAKASIESGFNPNAKNTSYGGLFGLSIKQFGNKVHSMDFSFDEVSRQYLNNKQAWEARGIKNPTLGDMYVMHQQGKAGAVALRNGGSKLAGEVLNPFYKGYNKFASVGIKDGFQPVYQNIAIKDPNKRAEVAKTMTATQFYDYWASRGNQAYDYWKNDSRLVKFRGN